ncbi:hypothetical protein CR66_03245 [Campylobacter mucosalis]|uniref:type II toxin-antitoxin system HicA family toxin n=1 Tax=Campylobacter mucosalis TaxID=202 RepID=UPI0004D3D665|nr:type II toxin-antitoxin system HicA family toxin [Campylobacter mucosalis]KEA46229.1 hypothetical protein CR66_03245 [Campylobacter mucosalis]QKF62687.1 hypothetical protein CMCT_0527 [Campylobacter mucosalis]
MSRYDKILDKISNNPKNVSFDELRAILEYVGFKLVRTNGSHHIFEYGTRAIVVPRHKPVKEIYVKNAIKLILEIRGEK